MIKSRHNDQNCSLACRSQKETTKANLPDGLGDSALAETTGISPRKGAEMAIFLSILTAVVSAAVMALVGAIPVMGIFFDFDSAESKPKKFIYGVSLVLIGAGFITCSIGAGCQAYWRLTEDPLVVAQADESYYTVVALEEDGVQILEDPNTGGLYARRETGAGKSRAIELVPLLNKDGTPMKVEDWRVESY